MVSCQMVFPCWMIEVVSEMRVTQTVIGGNVVRVPFLEKLALAMFAGLRAEHVSSLGKKITCRYVHLKICLELYQEDLGILLTNPPVISCYEINLCLPDN